MGFVDSLKKKMHDNEFMKSAEKRRKEGANMSKGIDLTGKKAVIFGVATDKSIAWNIAKTLNENGCRVALGYQERVKEYVEELAKELSDPLLFPCDMMDDDLIRFFFAKVKEEFGTFDYLIHSVAFAKKDFLQGKYYDVDRKGYNTAQQVSAFSLPALVKAGVDLMNKDGCVITMTYLGSVMAVKNYNLMGVCKAALESSVRYLAFDLGDRGIRVNAISAGPIATLAASGVAGFDEILSYAKGKAALGRNISTEDIGNMALFLCSGLSRNITGQTLYVDAGYSVNGL